MKIAQSGRQVGVCIGSGGQGRLWNLVATVNRQEDRDEGHGVGEVVQRGLKIQLSTARHLIGCFLERNLVIRGVDTSSGEFQNRDDLVLVSWIDPEKIRAQRCNGFRF